MKNVTGAMERNKIKKVMATSDARTHEGAQAWTMSSATRLEQICMTGVFGNSFYVSNDETVDAAALVFEAAPAEDLAKAIVHGRQDGFVRAANILGLVYLSKKSPTLFQSVFNSVIITGNDMEDFIALLKTVRGFGDSIKKAMRAWILEKAGPYYALKYRRQIADAIRLSHFKSADPIFGYILKAYFEHIPDKTIVEARKRYPQLGGYEEACEAVKAGDTKKTMSLIEEHRLDLQSLIGVGTVSDKVWKAFAKVMPTMAMLKHLNKLDKSGVFEQSTTVAKDRLTVENLRRAKVFPIRLYTAFQNVESFELKNILADVLNNYVQEYDWGKWAGKWCLAPDVSGSMSSTARCNASDPKRSVSPCQVAGMFAGILYKGIEDSILLPWSDKIHRVQHPKSDSVITHINSIANASGGGTYMQLPVMHLLGKKIKVDYFLGITDTESWAGKDFLPAWMQYRKQINNKAKAFLIRCDAYDTQPFSDSVAEEQGLYQVFGWSENVLKYIESRLG